MWYEKIGQVDIGSFVEKNIDPVELQYPFIYGDYSIYYYFAKKKQPIKEIHINILY